MKLKNTIISALLAGGVFSSALAGNEDRAGSAGANYLLINPWALSSSLGNAGSAFDTGLESSFTNVAGLSFVGKTDIRYAYTNLFSSTGSSINSIGIAQRTGESGVLGLSVNLFGYGETLITTENNPEGGLGTYSPQNFVMNVSYARTFSKRISGGVNFKVLSESTKSSTATGLAVDAGVRYVTGSREHIRFAISMKNVGSPMKVKGDALATSVVNTSTGLETTTEQRTNAYELPSLINIGASYDFLFADVHTLTPMFTFTANSFTRDNLNFGLQYEYDLTKATLALRGGYTYETGIGNENKTMTAFNGINGGFSLELNGGGEEKTSTIAFDYSYRGADKLGNVHSIGARILLR